MSMRTKMWQPNRGSVREGIAVRWKAFGKRNFKEVKKKAL